MKTRAAIGELNLEVSVVTGQINKVFNLFMKNNFSKGYTDFMG